MEEQNMESPPTAEKKEGYADTVQTEKEEVEQERKKVEARLRKLLIVEDPVLDTVVEIKDVQNVPNATTAVRLLRSALELYERRARMQEQAQVLANVLQQSKVRGGKIITAP